jgi:hypothetical protein
MGAHWRVEGVVILAGGSQPQAKSAPARAITFSVFLVDTSVHRTGRDMETARKIKKWESSRFPRQALPVSNASSYVIVMHCLIFHFA